MANRRHRPGDPDPVTPASCIRVLQWARSDSKSPPPSRMQPGVSVSDRRFAVGHLYPRVLYAFSDVVVYVCKNPKTFQDALYNLIEWGADSLETSVNQPTLPHIILALNAAVPSRKNPEDEWDTDKATRELLDYVNNLDGKHAQKLMADLNVNRAAVSLEAGATESKVQTIEDLILRYYSSFTVVPLPAPTGGQYNRLNTQLDKLRENIQDGCDKSNQEKQRAHMLLTAQTFNMYLRFALDHFTEKLDAPFNFVKVSLRLNPIPQNFANHVVRLAACICDARDRYRDEAIYGAFTQLVASCVVLDVMRVRKQGWATDSQIFHQYQPSFEEAFITFCDQYWTCSFSKEGRHCVNVKLRHGPKGHQDIGGRVIERGEYEPDPRFSSPEVGKWIDLIRSTISGIQDDLKTRLSSGPTREGIDDIWPLHLKNIENFLEVFNYGWENFFSQTTCFGCLATIPEHPLTCGHVLCTKCVHAHGVKLVTLNSVKLKNCPLHVLSPDVAPVEQAFRFKPPHASVRLLSLDGGGALPVVQLEVLRAIQKGLPSGIPIQAFFDMIIGSGAGAILALKLGVREKTIDECTDDLVTLRNTAFRKRELSKVPFINKLVTLRHGSVLKTTPLYETLKPSLGRTFLFGHHEPGRVHHNIKVAVTATDQISRKPVLLANYSRSASPSGEYEFHRPDDRGAELKVWEAGAAAFAVRPLFKPFTHSKTHRSYLDGTLINNNPIKMVDAERKHLWSDVADSDPDLMLSIGSGHSGAGSVDASDKIDSIRCPGHRLSRQLMESRGRSIPDADKTWRDFMDTVQSNAAPQMKDRYVRINPSSRLKTDPRNDISAVKDFVSIQRQTREYLKTQSKVIDRLTMKLVASQFFFAVSYSPSPVGRGQGYKVSGKVICRFNDNSGYIEALGTFFDRRQMSDCAWRSL
ncbi:FabD/lysophospholipase-like protein [Trichodelitschia bisporula]|uniref:FabD/lysophospholipase-like protein n=1 Tax=Trichodelitschia bisporula TaxID=703511 RepID=A0A6G1HT46_9PEZI|nr:FabD/lysophospholipase-like protein [Trichodelitschia bisporula]